jgi:hypothetical protein
MIGNGAGVNLTPHSRLSHNGCNSSETVARPSSHEFWHLPGKLTAICSRMEDACPISLASSKIPREALKVVSGTKFAADCRTGYFHQETQRNPMKWM